MNILGISAYYHDSAAALLQDGAIVAAAQEERFTRKKHDAGFPANAIRYCLDQAGLSLQDVEEVVFYDKPLIKFERLLESYISYAPDGFKSFLSAMPVWLKEKLYLKAMLKKEFKKFNQSKKDPLPQLLFTEHHQSHAASAFFPSPFNRAAVLCMDGVGEWATSSVWLGEDNTLTPLWQINFPHSLGLLYSAFTYFTGFKVNSGEYKLMGLAPYGRPLYEDLIRDNLIDIKDDGTFRLNMDYFNFVTGLTMTNKKFSALFDREPRSPETDITQSDMDIAASVQKVTEEIVLRLGKTVRQETNSENLCLAGGVALNCVANGKLLRSGTFENIWIQPASGDAGGAVGAACSSWYEHHNNHRVVNGADSMEGAYLGPRFEAEEIRQAFDAKQAVYTQLGDDDFYTRVADLLANGNVIGWFQGRMEFGPRALGGRSILGDPRNTDMQTVMNLKIKYRESFRPFAPAVLAEKVSQVFDMESTSPYMLLVTDINPEYRMVAEDEGLFGLEKLKAIRSRLPAITHVDYSARIQTVHKHTNPRFHGLLSAFDKQTDCPVLINTSFNVRGEPIVCTPEDAYRCFMRTEMDYLVVEDFILAKPEQPEWEETGDWRDEYELD